MPDLRQQEYHLVAEESVETFSRQKVVRDGFTMPEQDCRLIDKTRSWLPTSGFSVAKSGVLRAGLHALQPLPIEELLKIIEELEPIKMGRPASK